MFGMTENKRQQSILLIGGWKDTIRAATSMAEKGNKVYLISKRKIAYYDENNENLDIICVERIDNIRGETNRFKLDIYRTPDYVDTEKCTDCGNCIEACPVNNRIAFQKKTVKRKAIYRTNNAQNQPLYSIEKFGIPPCRANCPLHINTAGVMQLSKKEKYSEAITLIRQWNPFPGITSRICTHPCETHCNREKFDEPIAIAQVIRFLADYELDYHGAPQWNFERADPKNLSVGIIGAGPAGLMCAHDMLRQGYDATIYDALFMPGGSMATFIPAYKLPRDILFGEIQLIKRLGGNFHMNCTIGENASLPELKNKHDALLIAVGARKTAPIHIPGENLKGVVGALEFLQKHNCGIKIETREYAVVIGGNDIAIAAARTLRRLGSRATVLFPKRCNDTGTFHYNIQRAREEGVDIEEMSRVTSIVGEAQTVSGIRCIRMEYRCSDKSGEMQFMPIEDSSFDIRCDMVLISSLHKPDWETLGEDAKYFRAGNESKFIVNPRTLATNIDGIFAAGACTEATMDIISALASGRDAAISIDRYLKGEENDRKSASMRRAFSSICTESDIEKHEIPHSGRRKTQICEIVERLSGFCEVAAAYTAEQAIGEAGRCISCAACAECMECVRACPENAIDHDAFPDKVEIEVDVIILMPGFEKLILIS